MGKHDILLRLDDDAYERLRKTSFETRVSMSDLLRQGLELRLQDGGCSFCEGSRARMERTAVLLEQVSGELRGSLSTAPPASAKPPDDHWDAMMGDEGSG
jgi:hypothetical protein